MKKLGFYVFLLLVCATVAFYGTSPRPVPDRQINESATYYMWIHDMTAIPITQTAKASESPTITLTPTLTTTPTFTATMNYPGLVSTFLPSFTPQPTWTRDPNQPTRIAPRPTATTTIDPLKLVISKKLPANWTPTPPPPAERSYDGAYSERPFPGLAPSWVPDHIQAATDLMNFTNADQKSFVKYVDAWAADMLNSHWRRTWLLKNDFDHDGQPEWLVSIPAYNKDKEFFCCEKIIILFEKNGALYQPVHYKEAGANNSNNEELLQISDLNKNGYLDIVSGTTTCGSACSRWINIGEWDGLKWREYSGFYSPGWNEPILFIDIDDNGTTDLIFNYTTGDNKFDYGYPQRAASEIYSWKNGQYTLLESWLQPNKTSYAVLLDVYAALKTNDTDEALRLAQPALDNLAQNCSPMDTYTAIEVMLAHALRNEPKEMEKTLSYIMTSCNLPKTPQPNQRKNGFIPAANILWLAYQKTHNPLLACQTMERFIFTQQKLDGHKNNPEFSFDAGMLLYNYDACPIQ